ncbi:MAG: sodium:solute symporter [Acidobacteriota bacterium]
MNFALVDWALLLAALIVIVAPLSLARSRVRGVADFLAAGRSAGRYLLAVSGGIAGIGAISIVAMMEGGYQAGFAQAWWGLSTSLVVMVMTMTGWVIYRFRQTRSLTLSEFLERRYGRRFRIFAGSVAFLAGIINMGIFPAVGARFFIHFVGLPDTLLGIPTFPLVMASLLGLACYFVLSGGQVSVLITDFIQGAMANVVFLVVALYLLSVVGWGNAVEVLSEVPKGHSKINPFDTGYVEDFNVKYYVIGVIGLIYAMMSWQGTQAYNSSARNAHEAKMGGVLGSWRALSFALFVTLVPILVFTVMHHESFTEVQERIAARLGAIENTAVQGQMRAPLVLAELLPPGLMGAFAALMLAAFVSTHNTYLHSWGSIFVQDVLLPLRRRPMKPEQHVKTLRLSIVGVAIFIFVFSLFYKQSQAILLFFALTGAIFAGWSGAVVIGGLYTRWGHRWGAWLAGVSGVSLALGGFLLEQTKRAFSETGVAFWGLLDWLGAERALAWAKVVESDLPNGQELWGHAMWICSGLYIIGSVAARARGAQLFDLDRLLRRGEHALAEDKVEGEVEAKGFWRWLAITDEFSKRDRALYVGTQIWTIGWVLVFIVGTLYFLTRPVVDGDWSRWDPAWIRFWEIKLGMEIVVAIGVVVWFTWGGYHDLRDLLRRLDERSRDDDDDGWVETKEAASDETASSN